MDFSIQPPSTFVFLIPHKTVLFKVVHLLNIYQHTQFHGQTLSSVSFAPTS